VSVTLEQNNDSSLIRLEGAIDISSAAELKQQLVEALKGGKEVRVSLVAAIGLDVTAFQLMWAAAREARRAGIAFALSGAVPAPVAAALGNAGLHEFPVHDGSR
jgi:anti-anti-sigma factor